MKKCPKCESKTEPNKRQRSRGIAEYKCLKCNHGWKENTRFRQDKK